MLHWCYRIGRNVLHSAVISACTLLKILQQYGVQIQEQYEGTCYIYTFTWQYALRVLQYVLPEGIRNFHY